MNSKAHALLAVLALAGCTLIPPYHRPGMPVPETYDVREPGVADAPAAPELDWEQFFADGKLKSIIGLALENNRDLRVAALNVERAAAFYRIQRAELLPAVGAGAFGEKVRIPEKLTESGEADYSEQYSVNLGISAWELDFFGRIRSLAAASLAQFLATEHAQRAAGISIIGAVAQSYLAMAADQENLRIAEATLAAQERSAELIRRSHDLGIATGLELHQAQSQVEAARANVAAFRGAVAVDRNLLDLLAGTRVPAELLPEGLDALGEMKEISAGLPSEVLLERPDILATEQQLIAANANIGAARAAFFPRVTLTSSLGTLDTSVSGLFESGTRTWNFVPQILTPIFASGSLRANLRATEASREIAVANYERAIQTAFAEVSNALALRATLLEQEAAQRALVEELEMTYRLSEARYKAGMDGYLGVLIAERAVNEARRAFVAVRLARQSNLVELYSVLGGGL
ncbi:MAG: efflux transporter outer membrane subunit [Thermoanaerobaculia bacterium]